MAPLPKRKYSKARHGTRRSHARAIIPAAVPCPRCHNLKISHCACPTCGYYKGRKVIEIKSNRKA